MNAAADRLPSRVIAAQAAIGVALFFVLTAFGPNLLLLRGEVAWAAVQSAFVSAPPLGAITLVVTIARLRRNRKALRSLALGSKRLDADDLASLMRLPADLTGSAVATLSLGAAFVLLTPLRPSILDLDTGKSLALLGVILIATSALPLYVSLRAHVAKALEFVDPDAMASLLEHAELTGHSRRRLLFRLLAAIAAPVGLVAFGGALIAHAHVRQFDEQSREDIARTIARAALDVVPPGTGTAGRPEAIASASSHGFQVTLGADKGLEGIQRRDDGLTSLTTPVEDGAASLTFRVTEVQALTAVDLIVASISLVVAALVGLMFGRSLVDDLAGATLRVKMLGTEDILRGSLRLGHSRYAQVQALNGAIDDLAGRFRVFARAQERAMEAREAARRLRSLLFASVSHDLRSPLNAILGFTDLVGQRPLNAPQKESLQFIRRSGRELLALIETILEMARLEAGKLTLDRTTVGVAQLLAESVGQARSLASHLDVTLLIEDNLPALFVDSARMVHAIASLVGHCARISSQGVTSDEKRRPLRLRATCPAPRQHVHIQIEDPNGTIPPEELQRLLSPEPWAAGKRRYGGLTLGLSLARALVELHHGTLQVSSLPPRTSVFEIDLPIRMDRSLRTRTASAVSPPKS